MAHRREPIAGPGPALDELVVNDELPGAYEKQHDGMVGHLIRPERSGVGQDDAVLGGVSGDLCPSGGAMRVHSPAVYS